MKITILLSISFLIVLSFLGCASDQKVDQLEEQLKQTSERLDSLISAKNKPWTPSPYWNYAWFDLGKDYHQIVDHFYVSQIKTVFKENGFEVSGTIANLDALDKNDVKVQCAIKDSSTTELLTFGFSEMPYLPPGVKMSFTVFVPTRQTKISQVGVWIPEFRM